MISKKDSLQTYLYECFCDLFGNIDTSYNCHFGEISETEEKAIGIYFKGNSGYIRKLDGSFVNYKTDMILGINGSTEEPISEQLGFIETLVDYLNTHTNFMYTDDKSGEARVVVLNIDLIDSTDYLGKNNTKSIPCWSLNYTVTYGK